MQRINRVTPSLPPSAFKTYGIHAPRSTHWKRASCEEVDCGAYLNGWRTVIDEKTALGMQQAHYIRKESGRKFTEARDAVGLTTFTFEAGQKCFAASDHKLPIGRPEVYTLRLGDYRDRTGALTRFKTARAWVDNFGEHQERLAEQRQRG